MERDARRGSRVPRAFQWRNAPPRQGLATFQDLGWTEHVAIVSFSSFSPATIFILFKRTSGILFFSVFYLKYFHAILTGKKKEKKTKLTFFSCFLHYIFQQFQSFNNFHTFSECSTKENSTQKIFRVWLSFCFLSSQDWTAPMPKSGTKSGTKSSIIRGNCYEYIMLLSLYAEEKSKVSA